MFSPSFHDTLSEKSRSLPPLSLLPPTPKVSASHQTDILMIRFRGLLALFLSLSHFYGNRPPLTSVTVHFPSSFFFFLTSDHPFSVPSWFHCHSFLDLSETHPCSFLPSPPLPSPLSCSSQSITLSVLTLKYLLTLSTFYCFCPRTEPHLDNLVPSSSPRAQSSCSLLDRTASPPKNLFLSCSACPTHTHSCSLNLNSLSS